ncbi:MAG: hypothetical protein K2Y22_14825 [Candidatus Obscuribacterales bacterium]|nr:hypothetical protein [Candidatus Obscuribacterales bacterium]
MNKPQNFIYLALVVGLIIAAIGSFQSQYVQIPVPTDVTPPLGHGHERLRMPDGGNYTKARNDGEPVQVEYFGSMSFRHLDNGSVQENQSGVGLVDGEVIASAKNADKTCQFNTGHISTQLDSVTFDKDGIVQAIVDKQAGTITIRSLHGGVSLLFNTITIAEIHDQHEVRLLDGQEITVPIRSNFRSLYLTAEDLDTSVKLSDFVSVVKASPVLQRMQNSSNKNDRRIYKTAEKTAAALRQLH